MEKLNYYIIDSIIFYAKQIVKQGPPGPPPRQGLEWKEETHRWVCGIEGCEQKHGHEKNIPERTSNGLKSISAGFKINQVDSSANKFNEELAPSYISKLSIKRGLKKYINPHSGKYFTVNNYMRRVINIEGDLEKEVLNIISDIKHHMKPIEEPQITYRGLTGKLLNKEGKLVQSGDVVDVDAFMSTSRSPYMALFHFSNDIFMEIYSDPRARAITLDNRINGEKETIYDSDQKFKVISVKKKRIAGISVNFISGVVYSDDVLME